MISYNPLAISNGLTKINYLDESHKWYNFLIILHDKLSAYEVQKNLPEYLPLKDKLIRQCNIQTYAIQNIENIDLKKLSQNIGCEVYYTIDNIRLDYFKLKMLRLVLNQTMVNTVETTRMANKLVVKGYNVKISDIEALSNEAIKYVEIFSLNNLFIYADIDKPVKMHRFRLLHPNGTSSVIDKLF